MSLALEVQYPDGRQGLPSALSLRRWVQFCPWGGAVVVRFVNSEQGRQLNHQFRHIDRPTNVLAFDYRAEPKALAWDQPGQLEGDIALCTAVVQAEAADFGLSFRAHCAHLLIHGLLHLAGHDHLDEAQAEAMEALERQWLSLAGFGPQLELMF